MILKEIIKKATFKFSIMDAKKVVKPFTISLTWYFPLIIVLIDTINNCPIYRVIYSVLDLEYVTHYIQPNFLY